MRLRYFHLRNLPPLDDVAVMFGHESLLGRPGAVHFVVGVNGSGKSRLLQALAEVFLALEAPTVPPFPVTLAWDIGQTDAERRTLLFHSPDARRGTARLLDFGTARTDAQIAAAVATLRSGGEPDGGMGYTAYTGESLPGAAGFLPGVLLAYTSGDARHWQSLFAPGPVPATEDEGQTTGDAEFSPRAVALNPPTGGAAEWGMGLHVTPDALRLALIVMAVAQAAEEFDESDPVKGVLATDALRAAFVAARGEADGPPRLAGFRGILDTIDYLWPVTLRVRVECRDRDFPGDTWDKLRAVATRTLREPGMPEPDGANRRRQGGYFGNYFGRSGPVAPPAPRSLFFDLRAVSRREGTEGEPNTARAVLDALGGTVFGAFRTLHGWQVRGLLDPCDVQLVLRKRNVPSLLPLDALSDGERVFVGRMALFYLLRDEKDALVLLDEPETHFNDFWKRQMVDIIDDSLGDDPNDVVLTTHSSIALTDAFASEVTVLRNGGGYVRAFTPRIQTFGASPTEILQDVFLAPDGTGQRASEYLDTVLLLTERPDLVERWWGNPQDDILTELRQHVAQMYTEREEQTPPEPRLTGRIRDVLIALQQVSGGDMVNGIEQLYEKLGSGYYRYEFDRRLEYLRGRRGQAANENQ